ncbi:[NiFe]-hydrogenase I apoprotein, large subunit [Selenomonas ruminantium]|uniref:[NiFe]-hydrogenase I apoprotein, large subunit n=1 Tax=Selenomonas ruminantium TaxID=971 RepID=A0A1M6STG0_SELRU|nr:nickel-dependent hydrogenase large subunit [Selenomonas ruminantium]SHK47927.1 [NiFe]-hydrogenase I apoprotein, large subunit [Selenomonas ruminantium]
MKHVVVDPVTRIEGHLRVEVQVDEATGKVTDAVSSGTAWRGLELVMKDRDPRDAWAYIQRICGVCTTAHALGAVRAVEDALGIAIPKNANYIRNIMAATLTVQDHIVHFYHLHALDWVSPVEALAADPIATANLQTTLLNAYRLPFRAPETSTTEAYEHDFPAATPQYFEQIKGKVKAIVESGQLGIFSANWWDHPDYKLLPPEVHLLAVAHYLEMLDKQRELVTPHVIFGGKNPHPHYVVGGMPCSISLDDGNAPVNTARLEIVDRAINMGRSLVNNYYLPDLLAIGAAYVKAGRVDGGGMAKTCVLGYGSYPIEGYTGTSDGGFFKNQLIRCNGVVEDFGKGIAAAKFSEVTAEDVTTENITESVDHAWYEYPAGKKDLHPWDGVTAPKFTGPKEGTATDWKALNETGKYSWLKTPKWKGKLCEVGPLARYIIIYTKAKKGLLPEPTWAEKMMLDQLDAVSKVLGLAPEVWLPTMVGRTAARALDAQLNAEINKFFFDKLIANIKSGDTKVANSDKWEISTWPKDCKGVGLYEAPRGALSHYIHIKDGKTFNYQCIVPTTWNACPRDDNAGNGAYEMAMKDTQVKVPDKPLEIVKVVRSFDPCMACATHMFNAKGEKINVITTDPYSGTRVDK